MQGTFAGISNTYHIYYRIPCIILAHGIWILRAVYMLDAPHGDKCTLIIPLKAIWITIEQKYTQYGVEN